LRHHASQADQYCREFNSVIRELIDVRRDYATASRVLKRLLARAGRPRPQWQFDYATCLLQTGDASGAIEHFRRAAEQGYGKAPLRQVLKQAIAAAGLQGNVEIAKGLIDDDAETSHAEHMHSNTTQRIAATPVRARPTPASAPAAAPAQEGMGDIADARARAEATLARLREQAARATSRGTATPAAETASGATPHAR
jgi:hypothetical protein